MRRRGTKKDEEADLRLDQADPVVPEAPPIRATRRRKTLSRDAAGPSIQSRGYSDFEFNMLDPLVEQLTGYLKTIEPAPLNGATVEELVKDKPGIYVLLLDGEEVYVGKADSQLGLKSRLNRHAYNILNRERLNSANVSFKAAHVPTFTAMDIEARLIKASDHKWNGSGFGNNDPGRRRDKTEHKLDGFDSQYPILITRPDSYVSVGEYSVLSLLEQLKDKLPYVLRYTKEKSHKSIFASCKVNVKDDPSTVRDLLEAALTQLPRGYQAWKLPGRIIMYKERVKYTAGELIARSK